MRKKVRSFESAPKMLMPSMSDIQTEKWGDALA